MIEHDVNNDGSINLGDLDEAHLYLLAEYCDSAVEGSFTECEIFDCML
jgi:hypothetical protein